MKPLGSLRMSHEVMPSPSGPTPTPPAEPEDESGLLERARSGDQSAFATLVERHQNRAFALALRMVGSREEAEEIVQDAFVRVWRALPRFRGESRFSTWLYQIVLRRCYDGRRMLGVRRAREAPLDETFEASATDTNGSVERLDAARDVEPLVASLPDAQRAAITLYYLEERSIEEVARTMGIPAGTVKTHLHRARASLRGAWQRRAVRENR